MILSQMDVAARVVHWQATHGRNHPIRAAVEHPFRVVKRQFGFVKVRYRGLAKNGAQVTTLFALANLWMARKRILAETG